MYATSGLYSGMPLFLPVTGFEPGKVNRIEDQPIEKRYHSQGEMQMVIPSLGVDIPIVGVPKVNGDWDLSWLGDSAGYLEGTAFPTLNGNSALTAHVVSVEGTTGPFSRLGELKWGDKVDINAWGDKYEYEVRTIDVVSPDDMGILKHEELPWLSLITCQDFDLQNQLYTNRLVVKAVLVNISRR
jgi:LPXTG-site transpeptidase (sortase) family protein